MRDLALNDHAPPFDLPGIDGQNHSLSGYADASVFVVVWSCNHCPYVQAYENRLIALQRDFAGRGIRLVAINSNNTATHPADGFDQMVERARQRKFNFDYLRDESQDVARAYGAQRTPEVFVFDAERRLRYHGGIDDSWDNESGVTKTPLRSSVEALLRGEGPNPTNTPAVGCSVKWKS